jgi:hypothetical protein
MVHMVYKSTATCTVAGNRSTCLRPYQRIGVARVVSAANQHHPVANDSATSLLNTNSMLLIEQLFEWTLVLSVDLLSFSFLQSLLIGLPPHCFPSPLSRTGPRSKRTY